MLMTDLIHESFLAPLRWLGQHDWLTYKPIQSSDKFHRSRAAIPWGQGRAARKLVVIRPTLVSRRFFAGDFGDTTTTYEGRTMA
jgi:hypothetical protein